MPFLHKFPSHSLRSSPSCISHYCICFNTINSFPHRARYRQIPSPANLNHEGIRASHVHWAAPRPQIPGDQHEPQASPVLWQTQRGAALRPSFPLVALGAPPALQLHLCLLPTLH